MFKHLQSRSLIFEHLFTGTAGVSPAERASARSNLVDLYIVCHGCSSRSSSRHAFAAGETPAVPVKPVVKRK